MPLHDWTRVPAVLLHDFYQSWSIRIKDALNSGRLPDGVFALVEQRAGPKEAGRLAIEPATRPMNQPGSRVWSGRNASDRQLGSCVELPTQLTLSGRPGSSSSIISAVPSR